MALKILKSVNPEGCVWLHLPETHQQGLKQLSFLFLKLIRSPEGSTTGKEVIKD